MTPALVIFDCDGVIVDSEPLTLNLLRDDLELRGLSLEVSQVTSLFVGGTIASAGQRASELGATSPEGWVPDMYARIYALLQRGVDVIPGVQHVMEMLDQAAIPYCVASNGRMAKMEITLGQHPELWARMQGRMFSAEHVPAPKPAPDLFLHAARTLGAAPAKCVVIEDSATGARAARNAAMRCYGYAPHDAGVPLTAEGAQVFHDMTHLPELLRL